MLLEMTTDQITLPDAPAIDGLMFRLFRDESDYAPIAELMNANSAADGVEDFVTMEWVKNFLSHDNRFRSAPRHFAGGESKAHRSLWRGCGHGCWTMGHSCLSIRAACSPQWRRQGLGRALQRWAEGRLREIAALRPAGPRVFRSFAADTEKARWHCWRRRL